MTIRITKNDPRAIIPEYKTAGAAGFDLQTIEDVIISPKSALRVRTGLIFGIPTGHVMLIFARSSLFWKFGLMLTNNVGVLDADFCGPEDECLISLWNSTDSPVEIKAGSRLAQGIILPYPHAAFEEAEPLGPSRGGWGSTGS